MKLSEWALPPKNFYKLTYVSADTTMSSSPPGSPIQQDKTVNLGDDTVLPGQKTVVISSDSENSQHHDSSTPANVDQGQPEPSTSSGAPMSVLRRGTRAIKEGRSEERL